jgi:hypothetical protein
MRALKGLMLRRPSPIVFDVDFIFAIVIVIVIFVEVRQWIANVLDFYLRAHRPQIERMNVDRVDESRQRHLLEFLVHEGSNFLGKSSAIRARGDGFPSNVYRHPLSWQCGQPRSFQRPERIVDLDGRDCESCSKLEAMKSLTGAWRSPMWSVILVSKNESHLKKRYCRQV